MSKKSLLLPNSSFICLIASKGCDSISPTVPPTSIIAISFPLAHLTPLISSVMRNDLNGRSRKSPFLSLLGHVHKLDQQ